MASHPTSGRKKGSTLTVSKLLLLTTPFFVFIIVYTQTQFPTISPPTHQINSSMGMSLRDSFIQMTFEEIDGVRLVPRNIYNLKKGTEMIFNTKDLFHINLGGSYIASSQCTIKVMEYQEPNFISATFLCYLSREPITIKWKASLTTNFINNDEYLNLGASYIRQFISIERDEHSAIQTGIPISEITLLQFVSSTSSTYGKVEGSPIVDDNNFFFYGFEHPMASNKVHHPNKAVCSLLAVPQLLPGKAQEYSATIGVYPSKELLNVAFVDYLEKERAHPYRQFLHYNSWYDLRADYSIPYHDMNEKNVLERIKVIGEELSEKRKVSVESFLVDDGWDNQMSLWDFNEKFPNEFRELNNATKKYGFGLGVWLSPWGGYAEARERRLEYGKKEGLEVKENGFSLTGPKYYQRFLSRVENMLTKQNVNLFKFDGIGVGWDSYGAEKYATDISAMVSIITKLRKIKKDVFINLTIGSWASPYWLLFVDSIWRGMADVSFTGPGSKRRQWITYRDSIIYQNIVSRSELYPISNLMLHGILCAKVSIPADYGLDKVTNIGVDDDLPINMQGKDNLDDFKDEVWTFFGTGINLQELYLSPDSMTPAGWDVIADAAKWARAKSDILKYSKWFGDDPAGSYIYGFYSCSAKEGIFLLRNPKDATQTTSFNPYEMFQVLKLSNKDKSFQWKAVYCGQCQNRNEISKQFPANFENSEVTIELAPFQVLLLSIVPK